MLLMKRVCWFLSVCCLLACTGTATPTGLQPVTGFKPDQYLGNWYEIARLDHSFERGLQQVTATYSLREDGGLKVINRGYDTKKQEWKEAEGKAYLVNGPDTGKLKVSFFGPFYGAYNIIALDQVNYNFAMVAGPDRDYLWILSRTPTLSFPIKAELIARAQAWGFNTSELIFVDQSGGNSIQPAHRDTFRH
ncbi:apolipoprotein D and lipocalin family protein [Methylobacillus rhizosphaerae]|uniref:Outer membrane lipoprotein Blc n=2 Tax=Methylobacillus rhizosphaerae TaxID=551994 RepID=A0A238YVF5_9PROT|nr:apolipoprotein D and lipocalin family protein [Methylobacillus rhizosphaerae]